jgi:CelD/BcsL family acetyltransferase involved in cellulose biosynthesis
LARLIEQFKLPAPSITIFGFRLGDRLACVPLEIVRGKTTHTEQRAKGDVFNVVSIGQDVVC